MKLFVNGTTRTALLLAMFATMAFAKAPAVEGTQGTIISVQKSSVATPEVTEAGGTTDNPLQTQFYRYDISVRVGDGVYVGRYESAFDTLPDSLAANHTVDARLQKGVIQLGSSGDSIEAIVLSRKGDARRDQKASMKAQASGTPN